MSEASKYNFPKAEKVQVFERVDTYIEHNYDIDESLKQQIKELNALVNTLQKTHNPKTETEALAIIDVEFRKIKTIQPTRWQMLKRQLLLLKRQLLDHEGHLKATKATLTEIAKHYLEESVVAKALITYADTLSAEAEPME